MKLCVVDNCAGYHCARKGTAFPRCKACFVCLQLRSGGCAPTYMCLLCVHAYGYAYVHVCSRVLSARRGVPVGDPVRMRERLYARAYGHVSVYMCLWVRRRHTK